MNNNVFERSVLVKFKADASEEVIKGFFEGIEELKKSTLGLTTFKMQKFMDVSCETKLNTAVSNVIFPDVMTTWGFKDLTSFTNFLTCDRHFEIANNKFKPAVQQRVVFNSKTYHTAEPLRSTAIESHTAELFVGL